LFFTLILYQSVCTIAIHIFIASPLLFANIISKQLQKEHLFVNTQERNLEYIERIYNTF